MHLRGWQPGDAASVPSLLDDHPDPLWLNQFHALHGPDCDGPDWRRTVVATDAEDRMIGCATVVANRLHPGRYPCAMRWHPRIGVAGSAPSC